MNPILNPQEFIPDVQSKYTVIKDEIQPIDLNEDSWSMDYFVIFFHTGPRDPIATELLHLLDKHNNPGVSEFPCKIVAISMDSPQAIYDWVQEFPDFDVPMMSDKENAIGEQFGVMMEWSPGLDHPGPGYCANAAFIVDRFDKVRYHSVLDARCVHDLDELARVVKALRATDEGMLAMVDWKDDSNSVKNSKKAILKWQEDYYESYKAKHTMMGKMKGTIEAGKKKGWFGWWGGKSSDDEQQEDEREGSQDEETEEYPEEDEEGAPEKEMEDYNAPITDYATLETENHNWKYNFGRLCIAEEFPIDEEGDYNEEEDSVAEDEQTEDEQKYSEDEEDHNEEDSVEEEESREDDEEVAEQTVARNKADEKTATQNKAEGKPGQTASEKQKQPPAGKQGSASTTKSRNPSGTKNTSAARTPPRNRNPSGNRNPPRTRSQSGARAPSRAKVKSANRNAAGARTISKTKTPTRTRNQSGTRTPSRARTTHASRNASRARTPPRTQITARNLSGSRAAPKTRNQSGPRAAQRANTTSGNRNPAKSRNPSGKPQKAGNKKKR